jgi:hypothetical protein
MKRKRHTPAQTHYTMMHELMASPTEPLPAERQAWQLGLMEGGLKEMVSGQSPSPSNWRRVADAINIMESLLELGYIEDENGLLKDALEAMAKAGTRYRDGNGLRLDGPGIIAVRGVLEDFAQVMAVLPARTMIKAHRHTEKRIMAMIHGKGLPTDVEVMAI